MLGNVLRLCIRVVALVGALALWTGATLADGYVVPKANAVVAAAASWTGCYVGIDTGYKWGQTHLTTPTPYRLNDPTHLSVTTAAESVRTSGELLGGPAGCNYQLTRTFVLGLEVSATRDFASDSIGSVVNFNGQGAPVEGSLTTEVERTCQVHVGPHVGVTTGGETGLSPLLYATGGYAGACDKLTQTGQFTNPTVTNTSVSTSDFKSGWFLGAGVDLPTWCLIPGTFVQIEYTHSDYGSTKVALAGTTTTGKFENRTDEVRFGFKYMFGAASPTVSALK